jgi:Secretion system C-terminal sorting domain
MTLKTTLRIIIFFALYCYQFSFRAQAQPAPNHLKYFGFVAIDCLYDDPLDASNTTNYISEVDSFSNINHMCVFDPTENMVARVNLMNSHCVKPILDVQSIFFEYVDTLGPSGANYDLHPNYNSRWLAFMSLNSAVLNANKIGCFYIADEPFWNGISYAEINTVCTVLKSSYPTIPLLMIEAYTMVNAMQVPPAMDWVGFDRYGSYDPQTDPDFQDNLDTLKSKFTSTNQKIFLVIDDQWYPEYQTILGWSQNTMADIVHNYYDLAVSDPDIIGLIGYIWPGGLDGPSHHGVRNMTPTMINKNVEIGQWIKANYSPCGTANVDENELIQEPIFLFPNPSDGLINFQNNRSQERAEIYNAFGQLLKKIELNQGDNTMDLSDLTNGLYLIKIGAHTERIIKN